LKDVSSLKREVVLLHSELRNSRIDVSTGMVVINRGKSLSYCIPIVLTFLTACSPS